MRIESFFYRLRDGIARGDYFSLLAGTALSFAVLPSFVVVLFEALCENE